MSKPFIGLSRKRKDNPYKNRKYPVGKGYSVTPPVPNGIPAMLEFGEQEFIKDAPRLVNGGRMANLGCAQGGSAILLGIGLKHSGLDGTIHTVDIYEKNSYDRNRDRFEEWQVGDYIYQYKMTTIEAAKLFEDKGYRFNFVFIDAAHDYESVKKDFINYLALMNPGGLIAFHDTNQNDINEVITQFVDTNPGLKWRYWVNRVKCYEVL